MERIFLCDSERNDEGTIVIKHKKEITSEEYAELVSAFSVCSPIHSLREIQDIVIETGFDFKKWMDKSNLKAAFAEDRNRSRMMQTANKLVLNYAASLKTFIDIETRLVKKLKPEKSEDFKQLTHQFYDNSLEYRFWMNFRNYVVHCALPYSKFKADLNGDVQIICTKEHLLRFDNWKHSKKDIQNMPDEIDLVGMVDEMSANVVALYHHFFYMIADDIIKCVQIYDGFCTVHEVSSPVIMRGETLADLTSGQFQPFPVKDLLEAFETLRSHPKVNITVNKY